WSRSLASSKVWNFASNMAGTLAASGGRATPAPQHERHPAVERNAPLEVEALAQVMCQRGVGVRRQEAREHDACVARGEAADRHRKQGEGPEQDVGEDEVEWLARGHGARAGAGRVDEGDARRAVQPRIA